MNKNLLLAGAFVLLIVAGIAFSQLSDNEPAVTPENEPRNPEVETNNPEPDTTPETETEEPVTENNTSSQNERVSGPTVVSENLDIPWGIEFLPNGDMLVTERPGTLLRIERGENQFKDRYAVEGVVHRGEGGLLGVTKHPNYSENNWIYLHDDQKRRHAPEPRRTIRTKRRSAFQPYYNY